jgi:hypothetical protein
MHIYAHIVYIYYIMIYMVYNEARARIANEFLTAYKDFCRQYAEGWRGGCHALGGGWGGGGEAGAAGREGEEKRMGSGAGGLSRSGGRGGGGLYVVISPHAAGAGVAEALASRLRTRMTPVAQVTSKDVSKMAAGSGVVFALLSDGLVYRLLRDVAALPLKSVAVAICLLDVSRTGIALMLRHEGLLSHASATKKAFGMLASFLEKLLTLEQTCDARRAALQVCRIRLAPGAGTDEEVAGGHDKEGGVARKPPSPQRLEQATLQRLQEEGGWGGGEVGEAGALAACECMQAAMGRARQLLVCADDQRSGGGGGGEGGEGEEEEPLGAGVESGVDLGVVVFVTIVGWGKNAVCDAMLQEAGLGQQLGMKAEELVVILEGDALGGQLWAQAQKHARDPKVRLLILNRNFPPNSWESCKRRVTQAAGARAVRLIAVVPAAAEDDDGESADGESAHPFGPTVLAVCMHGVLGRRGHAALLDADSCPHASKVVSSFYNFYSDVRGGYTGLLHRIRLELTPSILEIAWLRSGTARAFSGSGALEELRQQVARMSLPQYAHHFSAGDEAALRACFAGEAAQRFFGGARLEAREISRAFIEQLRRAASLPPTHADAEKEN